AKTKPPATWTTGREIPKKFNRVAPTSSTTSRKSVVLMATLRARLRNTSVGADPTSPRKSSAEPRGLTTGNRALNASPKYLRTISILGKSLFSDRYFDAASLQ